MRESTEEEWSLAGAGKHRPRVQNPMNLVREFDDSRVPIFAPVTVRYKRAKLGDLCDFVPAICVKQRRKWSII